MIAIIDYDAGNIKSVSKALEKLGADSIVTSDPTVINASKAMILPGVGSFGMAMDQLRQQGLDQCIRKNAQEGKLLLGICLGMQLLFEKSYEDGAWDGLDLMKGKIIKFTDPKLKIPHMGWNQLLENRKDPIGTGLVNGEYVYFVHSYYAVPEDWNDVVYYAEYGEKVPGVVRRGNIIGMQFHPEKSAQTGMNLLKNFLREVEDIK
jgi:imidazole glycerol-phosphate synthase subunit HisH